MSRIHTFIVGVLSLFATGVASGQNCVDGQPIRPTYTSGSGYWGGIGVALAGSDLFLGTDTLGHVAVLRPTATSGYSQVQLITGVYPISHLVAESGTLAVGMEWSDNGGVKLYRKQANGTYALGATLSGSVAGEAFGHRVALSEDALTLAIGAPNAGVAPFAMSGKVYVYTKSVTTGLWTLLTTLTPAAGLAANAEFGTDVSVSGNKIAVADNSTYGYVFVRNGNVYTQQQRLTNSTPTASTVRIRVSSNWVWFQHNSRYDAFEQPTGATTWTLKQTLIFDLWGGIDSSWNFESGRFVIADRHDGQHSRVRVYTQPAAGANWANSFTGVSAAISWSGYPQVAIDGDLIAATAPRMDYGSVSYFGGAFIFDCVFNDCNGNGTRDECDIAGSTSSDSNGNGIPDECESLCRADVNEDGVVDGVDMSFILSGWGNCPP